MNNQDPNQLLNHLITLENTLKAAKLWSITPPTPEQLSSQEPFCVDTMAFESWLQWLFIPRLRAILDAGQLDALPHQSNILAMAEVAFAQYQTDTKAIKDCLAAIDEAINNANSITKGD